MLSRKSQNSFCFQHIVCGDLRLHVAEIGNGPAILFLHGFPEHWRAFAPIMTHLASDFRCIAPDQRGFGKSDRPLEITAYQIDQLADDIVILMQNLGLKRAHIVAHDWGGLVAWHFASRHPNLLDRLVIFNAPNPFCLQDALDSDPTQKLASAYAFQFSQSNSHDALNRRGPDALWTAFFGTDEEAGWLSSSDKAALLDNWRQPNAWQTMLNWYRAAGFDYSGNAKTARPKPAIIQAPTLLIWGQKDPLFAQSVLKGHTDFIADFHLETFVDGGHAVFRQYLDQCTRLVQDFLRQKTEQTSTSA